MHGKTEGGEERQRREDGCGVAMNSVVFEGGQDTQKHISDRRKYNDIKDTHILISYSTLLDRT